MSQIEPGFCQCGCGGRTKIARETAKAKGWVAGAPLRYIPGHWKQKPNPDVRSRFENFLYPDPNSGCFIFAGACDGDGYGQFVAGTKAESNRRLWLAHRFAWVLAGNVLPPRPLVLRHKCGVRCCCNPDHLVPGTVLENCIDTIRHGRTNKSRKGLPYGVIRRPYSSGLFYYEVSVGSKRMGGRYRGCTDNLEKAIEMARAARLETYGV